MGSILQRAYGNPGFIDYREAGRQEIGPSDRMVPARQRRFRNLFRQAAGLVKTDGPSVAAGSSGWVQHPVGRAFVKIKSPNGDCRTQTVASIWESTG